MTERITITATPSGWDLHGKTGAGFPVEVNGAKDKVNAYGWFAGWAAKKQNRIVFARR